MSVAPSRSGLLVDWRAVGLAALFSGTIYLVLNLWVVPAVMGGSFWMSTRLVASIVLGREVLAPPATFDGPALVAALAIQYLLAFVFTAVIAIVIHRGGLILGIVGGAVLGMAFYFINYYSLTYFFPQFFAINDASVLAAHVVFGAVAGGLYEWLEDDVYERAQGEGSL